MGARGEFPWRYASLWHVKDVLEGLAAECRPGDAHVRFRIRSSGRGILEPTIRRPARAALPSALHRRGSGPGPNVRRLLLSLVEHTDREDLNSRSAHIFFDNAQDIYGRKPPKCSEFGLDLRGRSTVMRESFRSTQPIMELAVNVLHRVARAEERHDHKELLSRRLLERTRRGGEDWLRVRFNQVHGPKPIVRSYVSRDLELNAIGDHIERLVTKEGIAASDICLLYNGQSVLQLLEARLMPKLAQIGVERRGITATVRRRDVRVGFDFRLGTGQHPVSAGAGGRQCVSPASPVQSRALCTPRKNAQVAGLNLRRFALE